MSQKSSTLNGQYEELNREDSSLVDPVIFMHSSSLPTPQKDREQEICITERDKKSINENLNIHDDRIASMPFAPPSMLPYPIHSPAAKGELSELKWAVGMNRKYFDAHKESQFKFDIDVRNRHGMTALHGACYYGRLDVVKWLVLREGANVNAMNSLDDGYQSNSLVNLKDQPSHSYKSFASCLHYAAANGHKTIVQFLIENGAECSQVDYKGHTALQVAKMNNHKKTASLIEYHMIKKRENSVLYIGSGGTNTAMTTRQKSDASTIRRTLTMPKIPSAQSTVPSPLRVQADITRKSVDNLVTYNLPSDESLSHKNEPISNPQVESHISTITSSFLKLVRRMSTIKLLGQRDNKE